MVPTVQRMMEKLIKHLQVVSVVTCGLQLWIPKMLSKELGPLWILEVLSYFIEDLLFFVR